MLRGQSDGEMAWSSFQEMSVVCEATAVGGGGRRIHAPGHSGGLEVEDVCGPEDQPDLRSSLLVDLRDGEGEGKVFHLDGLDGALTVPRDAREEEDHIAQLGGNREES